MDNKPPKKTFRSLTNYKALHAETAKQKKVSEAFQKAPSLTAARRVLFGGKGK